MMSGGENMDLAVPEEDVKMAEYIGQLLAC